MSSILRESSVLRDYVKKLVIVDVSLRHPSIDKTTDKLKLLMETMMNINYNNVDKRLDVIKELKRVEKDENVINFLLLNLTKIDGIFKFGNLEVKYLEEAWEMLKSQWEEMKMTSFTPWEGETLFMKGERSDYINDKDTEEILKFFPNSRIEIISKSGHWPHFDNQNEFIDKLNKFLQ